MSKECEPNMRFKNQTSLKRLTSKKGDKLNKKPSFLAVLLIVIVFLQIPVSLKASLGIFSLLFETSNTSKTFLFCDDY